MTGAAAPCRVHERAGPGELDRDRATRPARRARHQRNRTPEAVVVGHPGHSLSPSAVTAVPVLST
jgi:hypothetical protein